MLKHCHSSSSVADPSRRQQRRSTSRRSLTTSADSASLNSTGSASFNSSFGSSSSSNGNSNLGELSSATPEPISLISRASSFASLSLDSAGCQQPRTPIKVFAKCLRPDIEYKTLSASHQTDCRELIWQLLGKYKMKHRDPNLFYLTMDITIKRTGIPLKRTLVLDDDSRPAELKSCHPWGECKFTLQMRKGAGLVRLYDSVLMAESKYKALLVSENTTVQEVIRMLFHCYGLDNGLERVEDFCIFEQCQSQCYERRLNEKDRPAQVQSLWPSASQFMFVLRRRSSSNAKVGLVDGLMSTVVEGLDSAGISPVNSESDPSEASDDSPASIVSTVASFQLTAPTNYFGGRHAPRQAGNAAHSPLRPRPVVFAASSSPGPRSLPAAYSLLPPKPAFSRLNMNNLASIHESGLPPPPALKPKPTMHSLLTSHSLVQLCTSSSSSSSSSTSSSASSTSTTSNRASLGSLSSGSSRSSSVSFHDYENYFYI